MGGLQPASILVVDDDLSLCDVLRDALGLDGYRVWIASSIEEATEVLRERPVAAIVSDCFGADPTVPDLTHFRQLREAAPGIPIILCTGRPWAIGLDPAAHELFAVISKPFDLDHLFAVARQAVSQSSAG